MREWTYSYKSSDGFRHEGEINAQSKDEAFAILRKNGIKPIRVTERIVPVVRRGFGGLRKREWILLSAGLVILSVVVHLSVRVSGVRHERRSNSYSDASALEYESLGTVAESLLKDHWMSVESIGIGRLFDYASMYEEEEPSVLKDCVEKCRKCVDRSRENIKSRFREIYLNTSRDKPDLIIAIQRVYGQVMMEVDLTNEIIDCAECAIDLLFSNRGKWCVRKGMVHWDDKNLESEFRSYGAGNYMGSGRWQRDFGGIESKVFRVQSRNRANGKKSSLPELNWNSESKPSEFR